MIFVLTGVFWLLVITDILALPGQLFAPAWRVLAALTCLMGAGAGICALFVRHEEAQRKKR